MNYTEKRLKEFDKEFAHVKITDRHYFNPWIPEMKSFIIKSIEQAIAEERERVRGEIDRMIADELSAKPANEVEKTAEWYKVSGLQELKGYLSSLDTNPKDI